MSDVLEMLANGVSEAEMTNDFPYVSMEAIRDCLGYAVAMSNHSVVLAAA